MGGHEMSRAAAATWRLTGPMPEARQPVFQEDTDKTIEEF